MAEQTLGVLVQLRDKLTVPMSQVKKTVDQTTQSMDQLAKSATPVAQQMQRVEGSATGMKDSFSKASAEIEGMSRHQARHVLHLATLGVRLFAVQIAANELGGAFGEGSKLGRGLGHAIHSITQFASVALLIPGPIGLAVGGAAAFAAALGAIKHSETEAGKAVEEFTKKIDEQQKKFFEAYGKAKAELATAESPMETEAIRTKRGLEQVQEDLGKYFSLLDQLKVKKADINARAAAAPEGSIERFKIRQELFTVDQDIDYTQKRIKDLTATHQSLQEEFKIQTGMLEFEKTLKNLDEREKELGDALRTGLITPLQEVEERAKIAEERLRALLKTKDTIQADEGISPGFTGERGPNQERVERAKKAIEDTRIALAAAANAAKDLEDALKGDADWAEKVAKASQDINTHLEKNGFKASEEQVRAWAEAVVEGKHSVEEIVRALEKVRDADPFLGLQMALKDFQEDLFSFRQAWTTVFRSIEGSLSDAFATMIEHGKGWKDAMSDFANSVKKAFIKMLADIAANAVMKNVLGSITGLLGIGGTGQVQGGGAVGGGGISTSGLALNTALGLGAGAGATLGGTGAAAGGEITVGGVVGGLAGGAAGIAGVIGAPNAGAGALSGALAGASIGMIAGPIGAVVGLAVGAIAGAIVGGRNRRRNRRRERRAAAAAAAALRAQQQAAADVLKKGIQTRMGGGLSIEAASDEISKLFTGDVTPEDIAAMGPGAASAILQQQQAIANEAANQRIINVGAPIINVSATVSGSYDAKQLADDIGVHLQGSIQAAAAG